MNNFRLTTKNGTEIIYFPSTKKMHIYDNKSFIGVGNQSDWIKFLHKKDIKIEHGVDLIGYQEPIFIKVKPYEEDDKSFSFISGFRHFRAHFPELRTSPIESENKLVNLAIRAGKRIYITPYERLIKKGTINGDYFLCKYDKLNF